MKRLLQNFLQKNKFKNFSLSVDIHSHLIPDIDDGVQTTFEAIKYIRTLHNLGYKKLIITPHIMSHRYKNSSELILEKLEFLKDALHDHEIDMKIEAASEYYLDDYFLKLLAKKDILTFGNDYLLFEMSYTRAPKELTEIVVEIHKAGYKPVLAHPERYLFMHRHFDEYERLLEYDVLFQLNINSLAGYYNKAIQKIAYELVDRGMISFLGSDIHKKRQVEMLGQFLQTPNFQKIFTKNEILNNTLL